MLYTILIVDDEPLARKVIHEFIDKLDNEVEVIEAGDTIVAQKILMDNEVDILFLDINMPLMTGLELASSSVGDALTIFTTAYVEHAVEAFELAAFDYLVKPISFSRIQKSFKRAIDHIKNEKPEENSWMMVKEGKRIYKVPYAEVFYVQAYGDYVKIRAEEKTYLMKTKLTTLECQLPRQFVRSHRSYILNLQKIKYLEGNHALLKGDKIPISDTYKDELMRRL